MERLGAARRAPYAPMGHTEWKLFRNMLAMMDDSCEYRLVMFVGSQM